MSEARAVTAFVKLKYWEVYRLQVVLTATVFRKILYIWGFVILVWIAATVLLQFHPQSHEDWALIMENSSPLKWALAIPILLVLVAPLLSARGLMGTELLKKGVKYEFSDTGIHVETYVSKSDFVWGAIWRVKELSSEFLVFTNPRIAFTVPKRCLDDTETVAELRELFRRHVQKANLRIG